MPAKYLISFTNNVMKINYQYLVFIHLLAPLLSFSQEKRGADIPWKTYEAEAMQTNGVVMGPRYMPYLVETEASGQQCVQLNSKGQYVEFIAGINANTIVVRYSLPDSDKGDGLHATLGVYKNGRLLQHRKISSQYCMLYGSYPFTNDPKAGRPRNFYDDIRIHDLKINKGDVVRIQLDCAKGEATSCIIDLADLENIAPALQAPENSLSLTDQRFIGKQFSDTTDFTTALWKCIAMAAETGKSVWIPTGTFKISGDIVLPAGITVQGAGMWYSTLAGDEKLYANANRRVRIKGSGSNIHLSDFALMGKLNYRSDNEDNDGIVGTFGTNSTITNLWIEHTKVGMWIENSSNLQIEGCRMRNTIADGINFCVGMNSSTIKNCTARNTGDDCFAIWPAAFRKQQFSPGHNLIINCTAQLPFLANGSAIYGGESNAIKNCSFIDISPGSAVLISTTFPTENKSKNINNNFSGNTIVENCDIKTSGGFDHTWGWRASVEICVDKRDISSLQIRNLNIEKSMSAGISIIESNEVGKMGVLSNTTLENVHLSTYGIGVEGRHGVFISSDAHGSLMISNSAVGEIKNAAGGNFKVVTN